MNFEEKKNNI